MTKRMRELQTEITNLSAEANKYLQEGEGKDVAKAAAVLDEIEALQKEYDTHARAEAVAKAAVAGAMEKGKGTENKDIIKAFANAVRANFKGMNEGTGANGGYTVPEDINAKVNTLREQHFSLAALIDHETVTTKSGRRTYKTRSQHTGFSQVGEGGKIGQTGAPRFSIIEYTIKKYAGYLPITNELLDDSDEAIYNTVVEWLAQESVATDNVQILAKIMDTKEAVQLTGIADIKKAINVDLAAFANTVSIVTNADGLQYLDTLEDGNHRPLLSPDPTKPMEASLNVGVRKVPIVFVPNEVLNTDADTGAIPFIIGDLREFMKEFDRKQMTLTTSDVASVTDFNAFEEDMTLIRATMRADYVVKDENAIVLGTLTLEEPAADVA